MSIVLEILGSLLIVFIGSILVFFGMLGNDKSAFLGGGAIVISGVALAVWIVITAFIGG